MGADRAKDSSGRLSSSSKRVANITARPYCGHAITETTQPGGELLCKVAALIVGSRRLPGTTDRGVFTSASGLVALLIHPMPIELHHPEPFPGAACCYLTELPACKAAPSQGGFGLRDGATPISLLFASKRLQSKR
jgi:hypothetical protein